jgi:hypothetical protein
VWIKYDLFVTLIFKTNNKRKLMMRSTSFQMSPFPVPNVNGKVAVPHIYTHCSNMFAAIVRNKNGNVVVLEGLVANNSKLEGIDTYWLDLEPSYMDAARKRGRAHDRDEFGFWDKQAYGSTFKRISDTRLQVTMNQVPDKNITVALEKNGVNAYVTLYGELCRLNYIYVHDVFTLGIVPKVEYVEIHAFNRNREEKIFKIIK